MDGKLTAGLGPAGVLSADTVQRYSLLLAKVGKAELSEHLDFQSLDDAELSIDGWTEEGAELFDGYVFLLFQKLQSFYREAANNNQMVLVWFG
jgi:Domain of unknown function (DUF1877)